MNWLLVSLVISLTFLVAVLGVTLMVKTSEWKLERARLLAELDQATANVQLPKAGRLDFVAVQDPALEAPWRAPIPWDLAGAAYVLGQQRADQDAVSREVDAIMAEIEHNPERWQT